MPRKRKYAVRKGAGSMCKICGVNCGKGGALKKHIEGAHRVDYNQYKTCFESGTGATIADTWDDSVETSDGRKVITHVLVRRFIGDPGKRGVSWKKP